MVFGMNPRARQVRKVSDMCGVIPAAEGFGIDWAEGSL